jgi:transcriptional regulator with XRE-family HTH domain
VATNFIEALAHAARQRREEAGVTREQVAVALGASAEKLRYFESGRAFLALNDLLDAYEETAGASLFDLLDDAKANLKKNG